MRNNKTKWQAPGNSKCFDCSFKLPISQKTKIRDRSISILNFVKEYEPNEQYFISNIVKYLKINNKYFVQNKSNIMHFLRPLGFFGLIKTMGDGREKKFSLTIDGKNFLENIKKKEFKKATELFLICTMRVKYPNLFTKNTPTPYLYPFRVIYYLLLKEEKIYSDEFKTWIPFIENIDDLEKEKFVKDQKYDKFLTWVINCLCDLKILKKVKNWYSLDNSYINTSSLLKSTNLINKNQLFEQGNSDNVVFNRIRTNDRRQLSKYLIDVIKRVNNYNCFFGKHITFTSNVDNKPYLEIHHIIPVEYSCSFPNVDINCKENLIALCRNCHGALHHSIPVEKKVLIQKILKTRNIFFEKINIGYEDLLEMYS